MTVVHRHIVDGHQANPILTCEPASIITLEDCFTTHTARPMNSSILARWLPVSYFGIIYIIKGRGVISSQPWSRRIPFLLYPSYPFLSPSFLPSPPHTIQLEGLGKRCTFWAEPLPSTHFCVLSSEIAAGDKDFPSLRRKRFKMKSY